MLVDELRAFAGCEEGGYYVDEVGRGRVWEGEVMEGKRHFVF